MIGIPTGTRHRSRIRLVVVLLGALALCAFLWTWNTAAVRPIVRADPDGYSAYLPAWLLEHDTSLRTLARDHYADDTRRMRDVGLRVDPASGGVVEKYTLGMSTAEAPLFLLGHLAAAGGAIPADGFSHAERELADLTGVLAGVLGLVVLARVLLRTVRPAVVVPTLVCITLGTSLFDYMGYDSGFSHAFSFAAIGATMLATLHLLDRPDSGRRAVLLGLTVAAVALLRPTNALVLAGLPLVGVASRKDLRVRWLLVRTHARTVAISAGTAVAAFLPQLAQWHAETGRWVVSPYPPDETFDLLHPAPGALFSFAPHGLFPYAPVLLLAVVGLVPLWRRHRGLFWPVVIGLTIQAWLIASWYAWWYGSAFGHRGFVDVMALFAIPLAALFEAVPRGRPRLAVGGAAALLTLTTVLGTLAYWRGHLALTGPDASTYLRSLLG